MKRNDLVCLLGICFVQCSSAKQTASSGSYQGLGQESVSFEEQAQFAPKPLPPDLGRQIQSLLDIRAPGMGLTDSKGKRLFFTWSITGVPQIFRMDCPKCFPEQLTGGEDVTTIADLSPNDEWLFVHRDRKGEENPGLYMLSTKGGSLIEIQQKKGVQTHYQNFIKKRGLLIYSANDQKPDSYALYTFDPKTKTKTLVFAEPGIWSVADLRDEGERSIWLLQKSTGSLSSEFYEFDLDSKKLTPLLGQGEKEDYSARFSAHSKELVVLTDKIGNYKRLYRFPYGKALVPVTPEMKWDISEFSIDDARKRIWYTINEGGFTRLRALEPGAYKNVSLPELERFKDADHVFVGSLSRNGQWASLGVGTYRVPRVSYIFDYAKHQLTQWLLPSAPEMDLSRFQPAKLEYYDARDGTKIPMLVRRPPQCPNDHPCPVIVSFHGGPEGQSVPGFNPVAQFIVDRGFVYVEPNVRGSEGYGKEWLHRDDGPKRLEVVTDIEDCARFIKTQWAKNGIAPKVGITGGSYGGYSTLMGMTYFAGAYDAGVAIVGMSNLVTFLMNTAPYRRILRISEYGDPEKDHDALVKLSPMTYIDRVKAPLKIIQGVSDPRVPAGEALQIHHALKERGIETELVLFADEGHGTIKRENRVLEIGHMIGFFEKTLR